MGAGGAGRFSKARRRLPARGWAAVGAVVVGAVLAPSPAIAGTYRVVACDAAPSAANNAWRGDADRGMLAYSDCPSRRRATRGLVVRNRVAAGTVPKGRSARMSFTAPTGSALQGIEFDWDGISLAREWTLGLMADGRLVAGCAARGTGTGSTCVLGDPKGAQASYRRLAGARAVHAVARCGTRERCDTSATRRTADRARGRLALHRATVVVRDGSPPNLASANAGFMGAEWSRGIRPARAQARDNVGVRSARVAVDGVVHRNDRQRCDFTRPAPCPRSPALAPLVNTGLLRDGLHVLTLTAVDAAGNATVLRRTVRVDNHAPAPPRNVQVLGPPGIRSRNSFDLRWMPPPRQAAPIEHARYRLCRTSGAGRCVEGVRPGGATGISDVSVPARGEWRLRAWLVDAAGNSRRAHASAPVTLRFDDRQPARLTALVETARGAAPKATIGFGKRPVVRGSLSSAGRGVSKAPVTVMSRRRGSRRTLRVDTVRTDRHGRFSYRLARGPSRTLTFKYAGGARHRTARDRVKVAVRAKSSLSVSRTQVPNGGSVRFDGRILGRPIPREGKLLQLEARYRGSWRTFAVLRSDRRGGWHYRYRFEATSGTVTYPFRVRLPRERSYPYAVGRSRVVEVVVHG